MTSRHFVNLPIDKVKPAYRQIADQLRELIVNGRLKPGDQLPSEEQLSSQFGVSRNTTREALRILSSQGLVKTLRGVAGGSFVAIPDMGIVQHNIENGIGLLHGSEAWSAAEIYETRALLEIPSARLAAERRTPEDLERMRAAARHVEEGRATLERANRSGDFHQAVLEASGNRLLGLIAPPVWRAFANCAHQSGGAPHLWHDIDCDHIEILQCIEAGDGEGAAKAMKLHLERLRDKGGYE